MHRTTPAALAVVAVIVGGGAVWWFGQGTEAPSTDVTAPTVATTTTVTVGFAEEPEGGTVTYALTDGSQAPFTLTEELRGEVRTVVAASSMVLGEIVVDPSEPASMQIGTILVNARDFETDSGNRNRAIRGPILDADSFEFIEFTPTAVTGIDTADDSTIITFAVTGDLLIRDVANPVTFDVTLDMAPDGTVAGEATAVVNRTDWGIGIPSAPGVANVSEEVQLVLVIEAAPTA